jgi:Cu(I)/Ag(I) efflux system membrane fusion protein
MKTNHKIIISSIIALLIGLIFGYLFFGASPELNLDGELSGASSEIEKSADSEEIWTCSMHPQIRQNEPGQCPICGMDLIPLGSQTGTNPLVLEMTQEAVNIANIQTSIVGAKQAHSGKTLRLSGKVQADERLASSQVAQLPGRIEKLYVSFTGEQVNRGQKLVSIYSPELVMAQRELLEAKKLENVNPGLLKSARQKLKNWKIGYAAIEAIETNGSIQEQFILYANETGIVTKRNIAVGDYVKQGEVLFDLMDLTKVWVLFDAYEEDLASIKIGDRIEFTASGVPDKTFTGKLTFIDPFIDPSSRVSKIRTEINNQKGLLKPEMLVYGNLSSLKSSEEQLSIPKSAVLWTGKRSVVYVKVPGVEIPSFEFREIEISPTGGDQYVVLEGLEVGEEIVTHGNFVIDAAAQLNNQASMMNRNVEIKDRENATSQQFDYTASTPQNFKKQLMELAEGYLVLKDALAETDAQKVANASEEFIKLAGKPKMELLEGESHIYWRDQKASMEFHAEKMEESMDIEEQRAQFYFLSQGLIETLKTFGIVGMELYVQHCPMANENAGADWISREKEVFNPYFGEKMLKCGYVIDSLF